MNDGRDRCGVTNKLMFTKDEAHKFLAAYGRARGAKSSYRNCVFCNHWHTTKGVRGKGGKA